MLTKPRQAAEHSNCSPVEPLAALRHHAGTIAQSRTGAGGSRHMLSIFCTIPFSGGGARVQSDDHHVQANLPAAKTTTHTMRNKNIETAKLACFLNSPRPSLIRVVRRKNTERTKRKIGIAAARKAMILKIIIHSQYPVTRSLDHLVGAQKHRRRDREVERLRGP